MNWQILKVQGSRDKVKAALNADGTLSSQDKGWITAQLDGLPQQVTAVTVSGYSADHANPTFQGSFTRNIQLTISAICL